MLDLDGVDLFFVLSGFMIAHVHAPDFGRRVRLGNYIFNRVARVYPAVWVMTAFATGLCATGFGGHEKAGKLTGWGVLRRYASTSAGWRCAR